MLTGNSKIKLIAILVYLAVGFAYNAPAQNPAIKPPKHEPSPRPERFPRPMPAAPAEPRSGDNSERALEVDPNVNIQIPCINQARVKVNGWQRDEVRVFVRNGSNVGFKVHEKNPKNGKPIWIVVRKLSGGTSPLSDCLSGERIDIEVPVGAVVKMAGRETETSIDSIRKVEIKNLGGKVALRNVVGGIYAETYEGDVTVENSGGQITLKTSTGNIVAFDVNPGQVGDVFTAGTSNGSITLQNVAHRQIDANSLSGQVVFSGKFLEGGIYKFKTSDGSIRLAIPPASSCRLVAFYGFGAITSELPMTTITQDVSEGGKTLRSTIGEGDATVYLTTSRGRILIVKQSDMP